MCFFQVDVINHSVRSFQFSKAEIERVIDTPYTSLNRKEMAARRLLAKYHDNPQLLNRKAKVKVVTIFGREETVDPMKAQRTRLKLAKELTSEELEWLTIDKACVPPSSLRSFP